MFRTGDWQQHINVRDFIVRNYTPYDGDDGFLAPPTERTRCLWQKVSRLLKKERDAGGVLDIDTHTISGITSHGPGYIDRELEAVVGLQTDAPLRRAIMPFGGLRMVHTSLKAYDRESDPAVDQVFRYRKTHNDGVFDVYTGEMKKARAVGIITGLPDAYGRGRIIGDYRRVALYGADRLIEDREALARATAELDMTEENIRHREELCEQIRALNELKEMALSYGFDIARPARDTKEAIQWLYFGYLASVKQQNGAAMSLGRVSTFLDIYAERDLKDGRFTEEEIQQFVDHFVMKLRLVRFLRTPEYDSLFSGDPAWVTECLGGMCLDGRHMVTKMSFRFLHTLINLGPAPEPNLTVLWSRRLPENFRKFCARISVETSSIQYENDDIMLEKFGDDYGIACCVSAMRIGRQMQFFGARANLAKALLYAINHGCDEKTGDCLVEAVHRLDGEYLDYDQVMKNYEQVLRWLARLYINTLNVIHYMHDKYCYESMQMALHDEHVLRTMACGVAGLSVVADSLSAIRYARVRPVRDARGIAVDFEIEGDFPKYGNNDPRVDRLAAELVEHFMELLRTQHTYRGSRATMSILTITSNVVYGKKTGSTPDGRAGGTPFAPGANPMHGRDICGCAASMMSVACLPYDSSEDGISYTWSVTPATLGKTDAQKIDNMVSLLDGYFGAAGHHINVNVLNRETLLDAMEHPENYPQLTIRVSGYAVNFIRLTREQQLDVISRTFHEKL